MAFKTLKRFYRKAGAAALGGQFTVELDGKPIKTPAGRPLAVPTTRLAAEMAAEWAAQGDTVRPETMPVTQLAATALDRVEPERAAILDQLIKFGETDLLCYRADCPADLVARQRRDWQPVLDWAKSALGAHLAVTAGVVAVPQPPEALAALAARLESYDPWRLTAVQCACAAAGSLVLALALAEGRLGSAEVFALSQLDETYQIEQWGEDEEARQRWAALERDIAAAARLLALL
ncbi:MAG: ATPase [Magnetospirillum sp.]|nr:ATPase [Magnetospirillum sp.]